MSESESDSGGMSTETPRLPFPPVVLGIAGCSGSGKTTLAAELAHALGGIHFHLDNYYRDLGHMPYSERIKQNFELFDFALEPGDVSRIDSLDQGEDARRGPHPDTMDWIPA